MEQEWCAVSAPITRTNSVCGTPTSDVPVSTMAVHELSLRSPWQNSTSPTDSELRLMAQYVNPKTPEERESERKQPDAQEPAFEVRQSWH